MSFLGMANSINKDPEKKVLMINQIGDAAIRDRYLGILKKNEERRAGDQ
jgi:hypothetical protein